MAQKKEEQEKEIKENNLIQRVNMTKIKSVKKLSLWLFIIPFVSINICLLISTNYEYLQNTIFLVDQIGRSYFTIPYIDGSLSISRASRTYPQYLIFKPTMIIVSIMLYFFWQKNNILFKELFNKPDLKLTFANHGIISSFCFCFHVIFLVIDFDLDLFKLFKRAALISFVVFQLSAMVSLLQNTYKLKNMIKNLIRLNFLYLLIVLTLVMVLVAVAIAPFLMTLGHIQFKHMIEWNYFTMIITYYLVFSIMWKK